MKCCGRGKREVEFELPIADLFKRLYYKSIRLSNYNQVFSILITVFLVLIPSSVSIWLFISPSYSQAASIVNLISPIVVGILVKFDPSSRASECYKIGVKSWKMYRTISNKTSTRSLGVEEQQQFEKTYQKYNMQLFTSSRSLPEMNFDDDEEPVVESVALSVQPQAPPIPPRSPQSRLSNDNVQINLPKRINSNEFDNLE